MTAPWLTELPHGWREVALRYLARVETGSRDTVDAVPGAEFPFIVRSPKPLEIDTYSYDTEAVLTAGDGAVGEVFHHVKGKFEAHQRVYVIRDFRGLDGRFFFYYFSSQFGQTVAYGGAQSTVASLRRPMFTGFPVAVPPLGRQRAIADYLDRETAQIDAFIAKNEDLIALLTERRAAVMDEAFVRASATAATVPLKRAVNFVTVGIVVTPAKWYVESGIPALRGLNVKPGSISMDDLVFLSDEGHQVNRKSELRAGDVVVVRTGQAGAAAVVPTELDRANAIDLLIVRTGARVVPEFLAHFLNSDSTARLIAHGSVGSIQGHFNVGSLRELPFPLLPKDEQWALVRMLDAQAEKIDRAMLTTQRGVALARERRAALISAAVTGKIDVGVPT